jgi:hypothetical protein
LAAARGGLIPDRASGSRTEMQQAASLGRGMRRAAGTLVVIIGTWAIVLDLVRTYTLLEVMTLMFFGFLAILVLAVLLSVDRVT